MKWIGWICAALLLLAVMSVNNANRQKQAKAKVAADALVAEKRQQVEDAIARASAGIPELEKQQAANQAALAVAVAKRDGLQKQQKEAEKKTEDLNAAILAAQDIKTEQRVRKQDNIQDIKGLQDKVTVVEQDIAKLRQQLERVIEQSPTGGQVP